MDTGEDIVPAFARIKNSIRIIAEDVSTGDKKLSFVVNVILGEFGRVRKEEILAIQDYPKRGVFDVTFTGEGIFSSVLQILADNKKDPRLTGYRIFPHVPEEIILVAKSYSPLVPQREIDLVLSKYCDKLTFSGKILNELGIWTSKYKYKAKFKKGVYPPARFRLGNVNLDCHFNGMPIFCRKCRAYGHSMEDCNSCTNCGELSHAVKDCLQAKKCFLCFQFGHLYASCPMREKQENREEEMVVPMEHFAASPDLGDLSASPNLVIFSDGFSDVSSQCSQKKVEFIPVEQGKLPDPVVLSRRVSSEGEFSRDDPQEGPAVKRKKEKKERKKEKIPDVSSSRDSSSSTDVLQSLSRGERLYEYYKDKSQKEIQEFIFDLSDDDEIERINHCIRNYDHKKAREEILKVMRDLK